MDELGGVDGPGGVDGLEGVDGQWGVDGPGRSGHKNGDDTPIVTFLWYTREDFPLKEEVQ